MATKYGQDAITAWGKIRAAFKARRNAIFAVVAGVIIWLVLNEYVFAGTLG